MPGSTPKSRDACHCVSVSTNTTVLPCRTRQAERLTAVVVLPTPPLLSETAIIRVIPYDTNPTLSNDNNRECTTPKAASFPNPKQRKSPANSWASVHFKATVSPAKLVHFHQVGASRKLSHRHQHQGGEHHSLHDHSSNQNMPELQLVWRSLNNCRHRKNIWCNCQGA